MTGRGGLICELQHGPGYDEPVGMDEGGFNGIESSRESVASGSGKVGAGDIWQGEIGRHEPGRSGVGISRGGSPWKLRENQGKRSKGSMMILHQVQGGCRIWLTACRWPSLFTMCLCVLLALTSCRRGAEVQASAPPEEKKTTALKETAVVATLESPLPDHKNAIWCGTLQLAWNKLKDDVVREPIVLVAADKLSSELNTPRVSADDLDPASFYADAGLVSDGILERIQQQMARRFPAEPKPIFSDQYRRPLPTIVAYSYLYVNIPFTHIFTNRPLALQFRQSDGESVETTSFIDRPQAARDQVDILDYDRRGGPDSAEFAVDLCKDTNPYQIVLARISRPGNLGEGVASVEQRITQFKQKPDYDRERKLKHDDSLIVPDLLFKLEHHFSELEDKSLGNKRFEDYHLFEVVQMIDFGLSRAGLVLKSQVRLGTVRGVAPPKDVPRYFNFDKPFLIYVKKRATGSRPFFAMWVDNAELMKRWPSSGTSEG